MASTMRTGRHPVQPRDRPDRADAVSESVPTPMVVGESTLKQLIEGSAATISAGHSFTAADSDADVAVVDSGYTTGNNLWVGSAITIEPVRFTVIGIVRHSQGAEPDVYIPLAPVAFPAGAGVVGGCRDALTRITCPD